MNAHEPHRAWTADNQRVLVAMLNRIKERLKGAAANDVDASDLPPPSSLGAPAAIDQISDRFGLSAFERDLLLLCAGVEMDSEIAALCARAAEPGPPRPWASFGLALAVLDDPHWSALAPSRPLRRWRMIETEDDMTLVTARLRIDERVLHFLGGINGLDGRLLPLLRAVPPPRVMADSQRDVAEEIVGVLKRANAMPPALQLWGDDPDGQRDVAATVAAHGGLRLHGIAAADVPASPHELDALATLWGREVALLGGALLIECGAVPPGAGVRRFVDRLDGVVLISLREPMALERDESRHRVDKPDGLDRLDLWQRALGRSGMPPDEVERVAGEFRLSARDIQRVGGWCRRGAGDSGRALRQGCRELERLRLDGLAQRIEPRADWADLVLPAQQTKALRQIAAQVRHRATVHDRWGFAAQSMRGLGMAVLFSGDSGTGKTMAAEALAGELQLDLFRIDLAAVVSKYIGETEKNLARIFDTAEGSGAILLFDEADALFGRRSEVKDSHDRYANIEVSYLLQRMEVYRGLAILTTNMKAALDPAFQRRLRAVISFPFPDTAERAEIWRRVFPAATPTEALDPSKLAKLHMSGGQIRNIAVNAAFHAAEAGEKVRMAHLLQAAHGEAAKSGRPITDAEIRGWV